MIDMETLIQIHDEYVKKREPHRFPKSMELPEHLCWWNLKSYGNCGGFIP